MNDEDRRYLVEKNEVYERRKQCWKSLLNVREVRSAEITVSPGKIVGIFEKADQNFTRDDLLNAARLE